MDIPEPTVALSLNGSSSYLGLALGGILGGLAMEHGSMTTLALASAGVELLALVTLILAVTMTRRSRSASR
jgi:MFS transporter, DHA1 family, inner membrane transport protein